MSAGSCAWLAALVVVFATSLAEAKRERHVRLQTENGPVHVWRPAKYDARTAGIIVYVHGYFANVDDAWRRYHLAKQFSESGVNALFIACEAPTRSRDRVYWSSLAPLLAEVATAMDEELPHGRVVVVGHSGAHRTLRAWLDEGGMDTIVLLDALYGEPEGFRTWVEADEDHRFIDAATLTRRWTEELHSELPETLVFNKFPPASAGRLRGARHARVVYVRSQHDHMALVTDGIVLPMLLRATDLPFVADASIDRPVRGL